MKVRKCSTTALAAIMHSNPELHCAQCNVRCYEIITVSCHGYAGACCPSPLFVESLPVDVDERLAVHAVDVEDPVQVVHLVLKDPCWPSARLPRHFFTLLIQP